jgi:hypothetical protein
MANEPVVAARSSRHVSQSSAHRMASVSTYNPPKGTPESKRIQAARRSDEGSERSRDNTAVGGRTTEKTEEKKLEQRGRGLNLRQGGNETRELSRLTRCVACCVSAHSEGELEVKSLEEGPNKHSSGNPININVLLLKTFYCSW